jgi:copper chaperone
MSNNDAQSTHRVTFKVADMSCAHCVSTIRNALKTGLPGAEVSIDLEAHEVTVAGDTTAAAAIIRDAGYEPQLPTR